MYHVGIVTHEFTSLESLKTLFPSDWLIHRYTQEEIEGAPSVDVLFVFEETNEQVGEICAQLLHFKEQKRPLVWVWTQKENPNNRLVYLNLGADGVAHPGSQPQEWVWMVKNALLRQQAQTEQETTKSEKKRKSPVPTNRVFELNDRNRSVLFADGKEVHLTRLEYKVLSLMYEEPQTTITYEDFYRAWGWGEDETENGQYRVSNVIFHLRKKIEEDVTQPRWIKTVRSKGYLLDI